MKRRISEPVILKDGDVETEFFWTSREMPKATESEDCKGEHDQSLYAMWEGRGDDMKITALSTKPSLTSQQFEDEYLVASAWGFVAQEAASGSTKLVDWFSGETCKESATKGFVVTHEESTHGVWNVFELRVMPSLEDACHYVNCVFEAFAASRCGLCYSQDATPETLQRECDNIVHKFAANKKVEFGECMCDYVLTITEMPIVNC